MSPPRRASLILVALVVGGCRSGPQPEPRATPIDPALQSAARAQLNAALASNDEVTRAHAIEAVKDVRPPDAADRLVAALSDRSLLVRKSAAYAVGELRVKAALPKLPQLLSEDVPAAETDPNVPVYALQQRMAAIFALHRLGDTRYSHELEQTARDPRAQVRGETALIFGMLGERSAMPILTHMLRTDKNPNVRLQAAEALWRFGDEFGRDALIGATVSSYASDQMIALLALAAPRDTRLLGHVEGELKNDYPEVQLVAARAAGQLGSAAGYPVAVNGAKSVNPMHRALAALAFGDIGRASAQPILAKLLDDAQPEVRLAAAAALLEIGGR